MRRFFRIGILSVLCVVLAIGYGSGAELNGYHIDERDPASLEEFLLYHKWERIPANMEQKANISSFAVADRSLCAIALMDQIYVYRDGTIVACYRYDTPGEYRLLFDGTYLVIYDVRGDTLLYVDTETEELTVYDLDVEKADLALQAEFYKFGQTQWDGTVDGNGYYVTSHIPVVGNFLGIYEELVFVLNGEEMVVYNTYVLTLCLALIVISVLIAGIVLADKLRKIVSK